MTKGVKLPTTIHHACSLVASENEANLTAIIRRWTIQIQIFGKLYLDYEVNTFRIQKFNSSLEDSVKIIKIVWWPIRLIGFRLDFCSSPTSSSGQPRYTPSQSLYDPIFLDPILDTVFLFAPEEDWPWTTRSPQRNDDCLLRLSLFVRMPQNDKMTFAWHLGKYVCRREIKLDCENAQFLLFLHRARKRRPRGEQGERRKIERVSLEFEFPPPFIKSS